MSPIEHLDIETTDGEELLEREDQECTQRKSLWMMPIAIAMMVCALFSGRALLAPTPPKSTATLADTSMKWTSCGAPIDASSSCLCGWIHDTAACNHIGDCYYACRNANTGCFC